MSIRSALARTLFVLAAIATGVVAAKPVIGALMDRLAIHDGPWRTTLTAGGDGANPYERAAIAVAGLYALGKDETIYYTAFDDSEGLALDGRCDYTVRGVALPARWWSLTMYGADHYLVPNARGIYSRHANSLELEPDGSYAVAVSPAEQPKNWLPAPARGAFSITARLYNPDPAILERLESVPMPSITRGACR